MNQDHIVEEIRQIRGRMLAECNGDLDKLLDYYKQSEDQERVVTLEDVEERRQRAQQRARKRCQEPFLDSGEQFR